MTTIEYIRAPIRTEEPTINRVIQAAIQELNNGTLLSAIPHILCQTFELHNVSLYLGAPLALEASSAGRPAFSGAVIHQGLAVLAFEQQTSLVSHHVEQDTQCVVPPWVDECVQSEIAIPLIQQQQTIGVLDFFSCETNAFDEVRQQTLTGLAEQLSPILGSALLLSQMERRVDELSTLQDMTLQLLSVQDMDTVMRAIADNFHEVLNATTVIVYAVQDNHIVTPGTQVAQPGQHIAEAVILPLCHDALILHESIIAGEIDGLPWKQSRRLWSKRGGVLVIPLSDWGINNGLLVIYHHAPITFTEKSKRQLHLLTDLAAVAMSKAARYQQYQQQISELSLLYKMALKTRESTSPEEIALAIAKDLRETLNLQEANVYQWDKATSNLIRLDDITEPARPKPLNETRIPDSGIIGWVVANQRPLYLNSEGYQSTQGHLDTSEEAALPLMLDENLIGVLHLCTGSNHPLKKQEQSFLATVAHLLAVTLDNVALYDQIERQLREITARYHITRSFTHTPDLDEILLTAVTTTQTTLGARTAHIALLEKEAQALTVHAAAGQSHIWQKGEELPLDSAFGTVVRTGDSIHLRDTAGESLPPVFDKDVGSFMIVPLTSSQQQIIGTFYIDSQRANVFTAEDADLLTVSAGHTAIAIENVGLYENMERHNQHLKEAYRKLQDLTKLKDAIVQNISHEVRTPITFIKGYVELIAEGGMGPINTEQRHSLEIVSYKADEVVHIVNEIMSLQPLTHESIEYTAILIEPLLQQAVNVFRRRIAGTDISLHLHPIETDLKIYGDLEKIRQLCYNILDNAVKFSPNGGNIWLGAKIEAKHIHLTFTDEGMGIPENRASQIFDTFYQIDGAVSRRFGGLGLGLAVAKRIVEAHQGKIWVESELHKGSTFHVLLPQYIPQQQRSTE